MITSQEVPPPVAAMKPTSTPPLAGRFLSAHWRWLAMLNYEVPASLLEPLVPRGVVLDQYAGRTYVSIVGFLFVRTKVLGIPIPWHRHFEELNLRFYVRREIDGEIRRGVVFVKELVPRWAIARVARWAYNEPYQAVPMRHSLTALPDPRTASASVPLPSAPRDRSVSYEWHVNGRWHRLQLHCGDEFQELETGSQSEFITEHYWGYCSQRDGGTVEYQVEHPPWRVATAPRRCSMPTLRRCPARNSPRISRVRPTRHCSLSARRSQSGNRAGSSLLPKKPLRCPPYPCTPWNLCCDTKPSLVSPRISRSVQIHGIEAAARHLPGPSGSDSMVAQPIPESLALPIYDRRSSSTPRPAPDRNPPSRPQILCGSGAGNHRPGVRPADRRLRKLEGQHPGAGHARQSHAAIGDEPVESLPQVEHRVPMLSIENTYSIEELRNIGDRTAKLLERRADRVGRGTQDRRRGRVARSYEDGVLVRGVTRGNGRGGRRHHPQHPHDPRRSAASVGRRRAARCWKSAAKST